MYHVVFVKEISEKLVAGLTEFDSAAWPRTESVCVWGGGGGGSVEVRTRPTECYIN